MMKKQTSLEKLREKCELPVSFLNRLQQSSTINFSCLNLRNLEKIEKNSNQNLDCEINNKTIANELSKIIEMDSQIDELENKLEFDNFISKCSERSEVIRYNSFPLTLTQNIIVKTQSNDCVFTSNQDNEMAKHQNLNKTSIEDFKVVQFIDEGVNGKVYLAEHKVTGLVCSIKIIFKKNLLPENYEQLVREIKIQRHLDHPNIIQLYHFFADDYNIYLVLEPCLDGNLLRFLQNKEVVLEAEAREKVQQVATAIDFMHNKDIIHRDLKPENVVLHQRVAKICDFGWAIYSPLMRDSICGSPLYCSPEILKREFYDSRVDVWSLGIITNALMQTSFFTLLMLAFIFFIQVPLLNYFVSLLRTYQLLFQRIPFDIQSLDDIAKIIDQEVAFPSERKVSQKAIQFMKDCLQKNKKKRITMTKVMDHSFLRKQN